MVSRRMPFLCMATFVVTPTSRMLSMAFRLPPPPISITRRASASSVSHRETSLFFSPYSYFQQPKQQQRRRYHVSNTRLLHLATTTTTATTEDDIENNNNKKVPITLLSGFLGAGKTVTLQHLLENTEGVKIGVIVNDVASVNIDAKLISGGTVDDSGVVELQNGCACCSLADELLTSVDNLLDDENKRKLDAIVVELSGVADPIAIKSNWNIAATSQQGQGGHPCTSKADISQVVTLVDATTFGTDFMSWDVAGQRQGWTDAEDACAAERKVPELLVEQIEAADVIVVNKVDLAGPEQVQVASSLAKSLNDKAIMEEVQYGRVSTQQILQGKTTTTTTTEEESESTKTSCCKDPDCANNNKNPSNNNNDQSAAATCTDPDCTDPDCTDPDCSSSDHHSHDHSHDHSHSHDHHETSTEQLGIVNFVYKANRPFNLRKLMILLNSWPVPIKENLDMSFIDEVKDGSYEVDDGTSNTKSNSPFVGVLRSKGFCWMAPTRWESTENSMDDVWRHETAMYWSHAGKQFSISTAGKWWGTISKEQMKSIFHDNMNEYDRILKEDFVTEEFGDRRQELVFIGVGIDEDRITDALDECLVSEMGMERYGQELNKLMNRIY